MSSIFPVLSLDRSKVRWEDHIERLTPVEQHAGIYVKREDTFAPLGYGGVNGAKVRQIVWLTCDYLAKLPVGAQPSLLLAGSVKSPQLGRVAAVARHFGIPSDIVIGTDPEKAFSRHENVSIAARLGSRFHTTKVAYNPALQKKARDLKGTTLKDAYVIEYGLSVEGSAERIERFYRFASEQVRSLPDDVETLLVPAGSCNTTIAVLYGIARFHPPALKRVVLFGIGPTRIEWFEDRLRDLGRQAKEDIAGLFQRSYWHHPELARKYGDAPAPYQLEHFDLQSTGYATYQDEMPERLGKLALHPTYEGKMMRYMKQNPDRFAALLGSPKTCFWVVGSEPRWAPMAEHVGRTDTL